MRLARQFGMDGVAWSLRRLHCPVPTDALVLEVGSGGNPYARANVLLDAYEATSQRHWVPLKVDRPTVLGFVEHLPFRDRSFDFVIASHVLEHSGDPARFLTELQRVARAGYIEVPDAFMERLIPYRDHRLEVTERDGRLVIRKKPASVVDRELKDLYQHRMTRLIGGRLIPEKPFDFHVRYYWKDTIDFTVLNPEVDAGWTGDETQPRTGLGTSPSARARLKEHLLNTFRSVLSQHVRNRSLQLFTLLQCPSCRTDRLSAEREALRCQHCQAEYPLQNGIPVMYPKGMGS